jgi:multiple sugar transport system substrate-binding protein
MFVSIMFDAQKTNYTSLGEVRVMLKRTTILAVAVTCILMASLYSGVQAEEKIVIRIWDHFKPLKTAHENIIAKMQEKYPDVTFEHTVYNPADMPEVLQLAYKSGQLPDITTNITGGIPARRLIEQGWYIPIDDYVDVKQKKLVADNLFEGISVFDGKVYSVPTFNRRWTVSGNWYNKDLMKEAGVDAEQGLVTWDDVLLAAKMITEKGGGSKYGMVLPIKFTSRMAEIVNDLAMAAGAPSEIDWHTGKYQYDTEPYVKVLEFLLKFKEQGSLYPASISIDARNARARWAAGNIGMFLDGPWNIGSLVNAYPEAVPFTDVAWVPVPDKESSGRVYVNPAGVDFFLTSHSKHPEIAAEFFLGLTSESYYMDLALGQDQPPLDMSAIEKSDVHYSYIKVNDMYSKYIRVRPVPEIGNPAVANVITEMKDVHPDLGEIIQGVFSGAIKDIQGALTEYNDAITAERDRAIAAVQAQGKDISLDAWIFPNWNPDKDFTPDMY